MNEKSPSEWDIITPKEAAEILHLSLNSFYLLLQNDPSFPAIKLGRKWVVYKAKMPEWIEQRLEEKQACKHQ